MSINPSEVKDRFIKWKEAIGKLIAEVDRVQQDSNKCLGRMVQDDRYYSHVADSVRKGWEDLEKSMKLINQVGEALLKDMETVAKKENQSFKEYWQLDVSTLAKTMDIRFFNVFISAIKNRGIILNIK